MEENTQQTDTQVVQNTTDTQVVDTQTTTQVETQTPTNNLTIDTPEVSTQVQPIADDGFTTSDPGMNIALDFMRKLGFNSESDEIKKVLLEGDFTSLEKKLSSMGDKSAGWKEHLELAKQYIANEDMRYEAHVELCENTIFDAVGSKEEWVQIQSWAASVADDDEKKSINSMLQADKFQAKAAALYLKGLYEKAAGTVVEPKSVVKNNQSTTQTGTTAISPQEYSKQISDLVARKGQYIDNDPEFKELQKRRALWRG